MTSCDQIKLKELNDKLCGIISDLAKSHQILNYFQFYSTEKEKEQREKAIRRHENFFRIVGAALYKNIIVTIDNLVDSKSLGLIKYLNKCEQELRILVPDETNRKAFGIEISRQRNLIDNLDFLRALRLRRDKLVAHFDAKYLLSEKQIDNDAFLSVQNIKEVIQVFQEILNWHRDNIFDSGEISWAPLDETTIPYYLFEALIITEKLREDDPTEYCRVSEIIRTDLTKA